MKNKKINLFFGMLNIAALFLLLYKYFQDEDLMWLIIAMWALVFCIESFGRYFMLNGSRSFKIIIWIINVGILVLSATISFQRMNFMWLIAGILYFVSFLINFRRIYKQP